VEKHETCSCVAVKIKIKIVEEEKSRFRPMQQVQTFVDDGGKKKINLSRDLSEFPGEGS
jgi:hypothetical protein